MMSSTEPAWTSEDNIEVHMHIRWNMGQVQPQVVLGKNKELCRTAKKTKKIVLVTKWLSRIHQQLLTQGKLHNS
jgi:hypothetical protein